MRTVAEMVVSPFRDRETYSGLLQFLLIAPSI